MILDDDMSTNQEDNGMILFLFSFYEVVFLDSTKASNDDNDEKDTKKFLITCILQSKARRYEYLKHIVEYPKIMKYLLNDNPNSIQIPARYLEPFIKEYVS